MAVQQLSREEAKRQQKIAEEEAALDILFRNREEEMRKAPLRDRATEKGNNMRVPQEGEDIDALGNVYKRPEKKVLRVRSSPEFKDVSRNVGFGPKGNIFAGSKEQAEDYRRMYGGHGSENAKAAQQLRDMGREGMVMRRARERVENKRNPNYGGYEDEPPKPTFDISQLFGKGKGE